MLDISFSEIAVIGAIALVVLGPERLPKVARTAGHLFGRLQRYVNGVKADIAREMEGSELAKIKQEVQDAARSFEQTVQKHASDVESETKLIQTSAEQADVATNTHSAVSKAAEALDADTAASKITPTVSSVTSYTPQQSAPMTTHTAVTSPDAAHMLGQGLFDFGIEPARMRVTVLPVAAVGVAQTNA